MTADVTVIVATHDRADWLAISLRSIQTSAAFARLRSIETRILVVDDASPGDATRDVVRLSGRTTCAIRCTTDGTTHPLLGCWGSRRSILATSPSSTMTTSCCRGGCACMSRRWKGVSTSARVRTSGRTPTSFRHGRPCRWSQRWAISWSDASRSTPTACFGRTWRARCPGIPTGGRHGAAGLVRIHAAGPPLRPSRRADLPAPAPR